MDEPVPVNFDHPGDLIVTAPVMGGKGRKAERAGLDRLPEPGRLRVDALGCERVADRGMADDAPDRESTQELAVAVIRVQVGHGRPGRRIDRHGHEPVPRAPQERAQRLGVLQRVEQQACAVRAYLDSRPGKLPHPHGG